MQEQEGATRLVFAIWQQ